MTVAPADLDSEKIDENTEIQFTSENRIEELTEAVKQLADRASWVKNIQIENKKEERERFKKARNNGESYIPDFNYRRTEDTETAQSLIKQTRKEARKISEDNLEKYGAEEITADDLQQFFTGILDELELYLELAENIEDEENWRATSEKIWPMIDRETYEESLQWLEDNKPETESQEEKLTSEDLKEMFKDEVNRLEMEYSVEIQNVGGCFNIPEEKTVVVADGSGDEKRKYSRKEAEMLTKHELFHAVRAYNGYQAGEESGFPPILGIHTPFYDQTEEGGALYREKKTGTNYAEKDFDYHLRLVAAYRIAESDNYREDFQDIVEELIDLGGSVDRSFYLVARNREALRHHIYLNGVSEWQDRDELRPLMIGKVNSEYAEMFRREVKADGMLKAPEVSPEKVFNSGF